MSDRSLPNESADGIIRYEGRAVPATSAALSRREFITFEKACRYLGLKLNQGATLAEEYVRAKVGQEGESKAKLAAESTEIAAKAIHKRAEAKSETFRGIGQLAETLDKISGLTPEYQDVAFAELVAQHPHLKAQVEIIIAKRERLHFQFNAVIQLCVSDEGAMQKFLEAYQASEHLGLSQQAEAAVDRLAT